MRYPRTRRAVLAALVLLSAGCSLPLSRDVHPVGDVAAEQRRGAALQVIPPGPKTDAAPVETVLGFLGAQASADDRHAIAREFLAPVRRASWRDDAEVEVYDPAHLVVTAVPGATPLHASVRVSFDVLGTVRTDGSYAARAAVPLTEEYGLDRVAGQWRIARVPDGLRLTVADRGRSFVSSSVYYLVPGETPHVIPDEVFLPVGSDLVTSLVRRLFQPPSLALAGLVDTAVPAGTRLRGNVVVSGSGIATVDITGYLAVPAAQAAQDLSAQLVWTLRSLGPSFKGLRLLTDGRLLPVPGQGTVQDLGAWDAYDPDGLGRTLPFYYAVVRRLRSSADLPTSQLTRGTAGRSGTVAVDGLAVSPDRTRIAVLSADRGGDVLRVGPLTGSGLAVASRGAGLRSPSWGSGRYGVWLLRGTRDVLRVSGTRTTLVAKPGLPPGRIVCLAASRDGVRIAAVVDGRLFVGRIEPGPGGVRLGGFTEVLPALHAVQKVAWASSGELVVLGSLTQVRQVVRVAVDGSFSSVVDTPGLRPSDVAASASGIVLVSAGRLYVSSAGAFRQVNLGPATVPAFPG